MRNFVRTLNDRVRRFKYLLVQFVFDRPVNKNAGPFSADKIKKILFLRHDNKIGDSVVASFMTRELQKHGFQVGVAIGEANQGLQKIFRAVDQIIVVRKGLWATFMAGFLIRRWNPDLIVDFSHDLKPKSLFLLTFPRAKYVCSFSFRQPRTANLKLAVNVNERPMAEQLGALLITLGAQEIDDRYEISLPETSCRDARGWLLEHKVSKAYICINFGASARLKSLRPPKQIDILKMLIKTFSDWDFVLLGLKDEVIQLRNSLPKEGRLHIAAGEDLFLQMALVSLARGALTPDTSWSHIACAFGVPVVVVFRYEDQDVIEKVSQIWAPRGAKNKIVYAYGRASDKPEPDASSVDVEAVREACLQVFRSENEA